MEKQNKFSLYIGLLKSDMETALNSESVLNVVSDNFLKLGIMGFNSENIKGFWNGKPEGALKISFINTFDIHFKDFLKVVESLKIQLEQESILIEQEQVLYNFA